MRAPSRRCTLAAWQQSVTAGQMNARTVVSSLRVGSALSRALCAFAAGEYRARTRPERGGSKLRLDVRVAEKKDAFAPSRRAFASVRTKMRGMAASSLHPSHAHKPARLAIRAGRERLVAGSGLAARRPVRSVESATLA